MAHWIIRVMDVTVTEITIRFIPSQEGINEIVCRLLRAKPEKANVRSKGGRFFEDPVTWLKRSHGKMLGSELYQVL